MARAIDTAITPTSSEMRVATSVRENMSRPSSSVPNGWANDGGKPWPVGVRA